MHIGLNAHLLSGRAGYRKAGIHTYIECLIRHLPAAAPDGWRFSAMIDPAYGGIFDGVTLRPSRMDTEHPVKRILWEQCVQPFTLGQYDLVHALAFVAPVIAPRPHVVTVYDLSFIHYPERLPAARRAYLRAFTGWTCRRARRVIAISDSTARDLTETLGIPPDKIDIAAPGYDADAFRPLAPDAVAAFKQLRHLPERYWLFVGTLEPRKNLVTLIEAYARLSPADRLPLILGGGQGWDYEPIFAAVERHGLTQQIHFPGFIPDADLPLWYNGAEVLIYPSVFEGFGLPVLEAQACGTPTIVADASSLPEIVGSSGRRVPPLDTEAWAAALRNAHDPGWRAEARAVGLTEARRYSWAQTATRTIESYQHAL